MYQQNSLNFIIALILSGSLLGCSNNKITTSGQSNIAASQLDAEVSTAKKTTPDTSVERSSEAMRRFLMAELSIGEEQTDTALYNLKASSNLLKDPDPQIQISIAQLYLTKGDSAQALEELAEISADPAALQLKAGLLQVSGDWAGSLDVYRQIIIAQPLQSESILMLSLDSLLAGKPSESLPKLGELVLKDPKNLPALKLLAFCYKEVENFSKALSLLESVRQMDPGDASVFKMLLAMGLEQKKYEVVSRELQRELKFNPASQVGLDFSDFDWRDPSNPKSKALLVKLKSETSQPPSPSDLRYEIARLELLKQNFSEAVTHFSLLLTEKPKDDELRYTLALALSSGGRPKEAISQLEDIESSSLWYVRSQAFIGMLHRQKKDFKAAERAFRRALDVDPKSEQIQTYLATVLQDAEKLEQAEKVFKDMLKSDPSNQRIMFSYGTLLFEMGKEKESNEVMQKLIGLNPQHAEALNFIAYSLAEGGMELDRALDLVNRAIQLQPENGFFIDTRGWIYFKKGNSQEAIKELERAVELSKYDPEISEHLGDVYLHLNRRSDALRLYKIALDNLVDSKEEGDQLSAKRIKKKIEETPNSAKE